MADALTEEDHRTLALELAARTHHPSPILEQEDTLDEETKLQEIARHFRGIMNLLGLDLTDPSLAKTPERVAKMYVQEVFSGLDFSTFPSVTLMDNPALTGEHDSLVTVRTGFTSFCEHHFVPMKGNAYVAYVPKDSIIGLSKVSRVVRYFAQRPQLQERLTAQIADSLSLLLNTEDVAILIKATHFCVHARGVQDEDGNAVTQVLRGAFLSDETLRQQFLASINVQDES